MTQKFRYKELGTKIKYITLLYDMAEGDAVFGHTNIEVQCIKGKIKFIYVILK